MMGDRQTIDAETTSAAGASTEEVYRSARTIMHISVVLLTWSIGVSAVSVLLDLSDLELIGRIERGQFVSMTDANASDSRRQILNLVDVGIFGLAGIPFIIWFHRMFANVQALGGDLRFGKGWAIGGWFFPVVNLWKPKQVMNDIWRGSDPAAPKDQGDAYLRERVPLVITLWWAGWLAMSYIGLFFIRWASMDSLGSIKRVMQWTLVYDLVAIFTGGLVIYIIVAATKRQESRAANVLTESVSTSV
jgi:hypothetical protein